ncbi:thermostable carboxypeptidase 1 [Klebsiella pneumoniae]|uniref:Thermostable carboxypeptidase 1 n=1 Tax=Klebsiella pneumoniae TaxID=573 RepID=A0A4P0Y7A7_KLEPN|nr:thermostable carboxypeptidase 1 [Klebsiella pneumoniae]
MTENTPYQQLTRTFQRLSRFSHLAAIAGWDMFAMMPPGGSVARGEALAELGVLQHQILTDKKVGQWLQEARLQDLNDVEQANLREMQRQYDQAALLPESLVEAKSLAGSRCEHAWRSQRPANDWTGFADNLREVVRLSRQEAQIRADARGGSRYDALLDIFEPDMTSARLDSLFADLKSWLPSLLSQAVEKQAKQTLIAPQGPFPIAEQRELGLQAMRILGFDFDGGAPRHQRPPVLRRRTPGCAHHHPLQRKRPAQRSVRRDPRNRPRPLRAESTSPVGRPARRTRPLHRYPRVAEPVF